MIRYNPDTTQFGIFYNGMYIGSERNYFDADERFNMLSFCGIRFDDKTKEWVFEVNLREVMRSFDKGEAEKAREEYIKNSYSTMLKGK